MAVDGTSVAFWNGSSFFPLDARNGLGEYGGNPYVDVISCASPSFCMAFGSGMDTNVFAFTWDGTTWQSNGAAAGADSPGDTAPVCTATNVCTAFDTGSLGGVIVKFWNGTRWYGNEQIVRGAYYSAAACLAVRSCVVVGETSRQLFADSFGFGRPAM